MNQEINERPEKDADNEIQSEQIMEVEASIDEGVLDVSETDAQKSPP